MKQKQAVSSIEQGVGRVSGKCLLPTEYCLLVELGDWKFRDWKFRNQV